MNNPQQWEPERGSWLDKLAYLDSFVTGKPWANVCHTARNFSQSHTFEDFALGELYYLSDGGYSRINICDIEPIKLQLCAGAREEVREKWALCKELIADIEEAVAFA